MESTRDYSNYGSQLYEINTKRETATMDTRTPTSVYSQTSRRTFDSPLLSAVNFLSPRSVEDFEPIFSPSLRSYVPRPPGYSLSDWDSLRSSPISMRSCPLPATFDFNPIRLSLPSMVRPSDSECAEWAVNAPAVKTQSVGERPKGTSYFSRHLRDVDARKAVGDASSGAPLQVDLSTFIPARDTVTTLMLQNLPDKYTKSDMLDEITCRGFLYDINFFYLPIDVRHKRAAGYCFVNLTSLEATSQFLRAFDGAWLHGKTNRTVCHVAPGHIQGLAANIQYYQDSHLATLKEMYQPLIFTNGVSQPLFKTQDSRASDSGTIRPAVSRSRTSDSPDTDAATTLMLRGIPNKYTRNLLLEEFEERGFLNDIDFLYLPIDLRHHCNVGYCFINLTNKEAVDRFSNVFSGMALQKVRSGKTCEVTIGRIQGQEANIDLYRNTSVMTMRDEYRPIIMKNGVRQTFPHATISRQELFRCAAQRSGVSCRSLER